MRNNLSGDQISRPVHATTGRSKWRGGFTLVEMLIVMMILAVLAALVVPRFQNHSSDAEVAALRSNLRAMRVMLQQYHATHGAWPADIDATWFAGGTPDHPQNSFEIPAVQVADQPNRTEPAGRILTKSVGGAYWYNRGNGRVRARVARQATMAETNALYAQVNTD